MLQRGSTGFELIGPTGGCFVAQTCWWDQTCDCRLTPDSVTRGQHGRPDPLLQGSNQRGQKGKSHVPPVMLWVTCRVRLHLRPPARPSSRPSLDKVGGCCWGPQLLTDPPPPSRSYRQIQRKTCVLVSPTTLVFLHRTERLCRSMIDCSVY